MKVKVVNEAAMIGASVDHYTDRARDAYNNIEKYFPKVNDAQFMSKIKEVLDKPLKLHGLVLSNIVNIVPPVACFSYAGIVARLHHELGVDGAVYIGLSSKNPNRDLPSLQKLINIAAVNHCWFTSKKGTVHETSLLATHMYSLRELRLNKSPSVKDTTTIYVK